MVFVLLLMLMRDVLMCVGFGGEEDEVTRFGWGAWRWAFDCIAKSLYVRFDAPHIGYLTSALRSTVA